MIIRNSEFLKSTSCLKNSQGVGDGRLVMCNLLRVNTLGLLCGVHVSLAWGWSRHHKVDFT